MSDSWIEFTWERYAGGVMVTCALTGVRPRRAWLVKLNRWAYELSQLRLEKTETLQDVLGRFFNHLKAKGGGQIISHEGPYVQATAEKDRTLHVLVLVPVLGAGPLSVLESVDNTLMFKGLIGPRPGPMAQFIPQALGWKDAHLMDEPEQLAA